MSAISKITENTPIRLTLVFSIAAACWWLATAVNNIERDIREIRGLLSEEWTVGDQERWALTLRADNPSVRVPEVHRRVH